MEKGFGACPRCRAGLGCQRGVGTQDEHLQARFFGGELLAGQGAKVAFGPADDERAVSCGDWFPATDGLETLADQYRAGTLEQMRGRAAGVENAIARPDQEAAVMTVLHEKLKESPGARVDREVEVCPSIRGRADAA